jgi:hypothetical protein
MLTWMATALIALAVIYSGLVALGACRWGKATRELIAGLDAAGTSGGPRRHDAGAAAHLPAPVRRYLKLALSDGQPIIRSADVALKGIFNMSLEAPQWKPFTSKQHVVTNRPGFVWNARIALFPGMAVRVHDAYVAGEGILRPALLGLFSLGKVRGTGDIARGELMRWLAEAVWYPTALLPGQGVDWQAVDECSATATLTEGPVRLTMLFRFGKDGLVSGIHVDARGGSVGGKTVFMPWEGRFRDYRAQDGMLIPFFGEVAWITPEGEKPYFRGSVTKVDYRFAE